MQKKLKKVELLIIALMITCSVYGQTVVYDGGTTNRPIAVNGLVVNGIAYNMTFTYNVTIDGTIRTVLDISESQEVGNGLRDLLNTQGIDSDFTRIYFVNADNAGSFNTVAVTDVSTGTND